jgi:hypothetical protein
MAAGKPPANAPPLPDDDRQFQQVWLAFFDSIAVPLMALERLAGSTSYANDAAAAAGGVKVGGFYRSGSAVMVRVV